MAIQCYRSHRNYNLRRYVLCASRELPAYFIVDGPEVRAQTDKGSFLSLNADPPPKMHEE